jgi:mannose-6-phosphate isomerase-like protein (cupin superfamily)
MSKKEVATDTAPVILRSANAGEFFTSEQCHIRELSNSEGDPQLSIAEARVEPGVTTRWHRLDGITERYCIVTGQGEVEVGALPAQAVSKGDIVIIPPGCRQRIRNTGNEDLVFLAICTPRFTPESYQELS